MRVPVIYNRTIRQPPNFRPPYNRYSSVPYPHYSHHNQQWPPNQHRQSISSSSYHKHRHQNHQNRIRTSQLPTTSTTNRSPLISNVAQNGDDGGPIYDQSSSTSDNQNLDDYELSFWKESWTLDKHRTDAHEFFFYIESVCNAWFSFEIATRFLVSFFCACVIIPADFSCNF